MPLKRSDLDQAVRYLKHARGLLEGLPGAKTGATRDVLDLAIRRLSPGDFYAGNAAAEITVLRHIAGKVARTDVLKAVATYLRTRWSAVRIRPGAHENKNLALVICTACAIHSVIAVGSHEN
jgi:hypothetical protein